MTPFRDRESPSPTRFRIQERAAARAESLAAFEVQTKGSLSSRTSASVKRHHPLKSNSGNQGPFFGPPIHYGTLLKKGP